MSARRQQESADTPPPLALVRAPLLDEACSDHGNARRLAHRHRDSLRYVPAVGWFAWIDSYWARDVEHIAAARLASETIIATGHAALDLPASDRRRDALVKHALASQNTNKLAALLEQAKSQVEFTASMNELDQLTGTLTCPNGVVDLQTGALRPARRADLGTRCAAVDYDPRARCPVFLAMLRRIQPDVATRRWLQKAVGYSATGTTREEKIFFPNGAGQNGKSKFMDAVSYALGTYAAATPPRTFLEGTGDAIPNDLAKLVGVRLVTAHEVGEQKPLACGRLKSLTGRDPISARFLFREWFTFTGQFVPWMISNGRPQVDDTSPAFWRRMRVLPFRVEIPEGEQDQALLEKLRSEAPGILRWIVQGARRWYGRTGTGTLGWCPEVRAATEEYRTESDSIGEWLEDCTDRRDPRTHTPFAMLYANYTAWAMANGVEVVSRQKVGRVLGQRGHADGKLAGIRVRKGLRLRHEPDGDDPPS